MNISSDVHQKTIQTSRGFQKACRKALSAFALRAQEADEVKVLFGERGSTERLLASNMKLRNIATFILADLFAQHCEASLAVPQRQHWHLSFLGPLVLERHPQLDVDAYRAAVYRMLHKAGLNAVFAIELQCLTNYPQRGLGRCFLLNAHAVCWSDNPEFDIEGAVTTMKASTAIHSHFGAPTVSYSARSTEPGHIEYLAYYLLKAPLTGKYRTRDPVIPSRWVFKPTKVNRSELLLRLGEVLSMLEFTDLVWGVGGGRDLRGAWRRKLTSWNSAECASISQPLEQDFATARWWESVRDRQGGANPYHTVEFIGPRPRKTRDERNRILHRLRPSARPNWVPRDA